MKKRVIIIGGGPAGYHSALSCRNTGMEVILIEQNRIGGTCTHKGCVPTRAYLSVIKAMHQLTAVSADSATALQIDRRQLADETKGKIDRLTFGMEYMLNRKRISCIQDYASITNEREVSLSDGTKLSCDHVIVATGSEAIVPSSHGFVHLHDAAELLTLENLPQEITVVGAGVLGVELAVILQGLGVNVTLSERENRILPGWDEDISKHMQAYLEKLGIKIAIDAANPHSEHGVFCIGRKPKLPPLKDGISLHAPWLHIIGDAGGGTMTADSAITQGSKIVEQILAGTSASADKFQTKCLFTPLEAASVGIAAGPETLVAYQDLGYTPAGILFDTDLGFIKVVIDKKTRILKGVHVVSDKASEIIQIGQLAVAQGMTVEDFCALTFPHPTEGELLKEVVRFV